MVIYILLTLLVFVCISFKKNITLYIVIFILMLSIASFRGFDIGTDTRNYLNTYDTIADNPLIGLIIVEPGWVIINILSKYIFNDYRGVLFLSQLIILLFVFSRSWYSSSNPYLGILFYILLYYYLQSYNITRQIISLSIIFYSYPFLINRQIKYYAFVLLASCFHYSALVCVLFPFIIKIKFSASSWSMILFITFIIGIIMGKSIIIMFPNIGKYQFYLSNQIQDASFSPTRLVLNCLFIFLCYHLRSTSYLVLCLWGIIILNLMSFSPAIGRIANYFMISQILLFTNYKCKNSHNFQKIRVLLIIYGFANFFVFLSANVGDVVPYVFFK